MLTRLITPAFAAYLATLPNLVTIQGMYALCGSPLLLALLFSAVGHANSKMMTVIQGERFPSDIGSLCLAPRTMLSQPRG